MKSKNFFGESRSGSRTQRRSMRFHVAQLTVMVSVLTVVPGRATRLQGGVHLVLLAAFLFLAIAP